MSDAWIGATITRNLFKVSPRDLPEHPTCGLCGLGVVVRDVRVPLTCFSIAIGVDSPLRVINRRMTLCDDCVRTIVGGKATEQILGGEP